MTLAQTLFGDTPPPPPLPPPPWLEGWFLESSIGACCLLGLACAVGLGLMPRIGRRTAGRWVAVGGVVAALAAAGIAWRVETPREQAILANAEAVAAFARADSEYARRVLLPSATLTLLGQASSMQTPEMVRRVAQDLGGRYALRERRAKVSSSTAFEDGPGIVRVLCRVQAVHDATGFPASCWWLIHWRKSEGRDGWQITGLELVQFEGLPPGTRIDP